MNAPRQALAVLALLGLGGCIVAPLEPSIPVMPAPGKSFEAFQADDEACRQYAAQRTGMAPSDAANRSVLAGAAAGTLLGAGMGAAIGAAFANPAAGAAIGAASGLTLGTISGLGAAHYSGANVQRRYDISYAQCMVAKGENVPPMTYTSYRGYGYPRYGYYAAYSSAPPYTVQLPPRVAANYEVYFALGSDRLPTDASAVIEQAVAAFHSARTSSIALIGHADRSGEARGNQTLSERRAQNVAAALIRAGIPGNSIFVSARGESDLAVPTPDGVAEPRNRRVTIVLGGGPTS